MRHRGRDSSRMSRRSQWNSRRSVKLLSTSDWFGVGPVIGVVPRPRNHDPQRGAVEGATQPATSSGTRPGTVSTWILGRRSSTVSSWRISDRLTEPDRSVPTPEVPTMSMTDQPSNPNKALWEKGDFTQIAATMRESGEAVGGFGGHRRGPGRARPRLR